MSNYGRNFEFRITPRGAARDGRYVTPASPAGGLPMGIPVEIDTAVAVTALGLQTLKVSAADTARAEGSGQGILVYEYGPAAFAGYDPELTLYSDLGVAPASAAVQVVHGPNIKILLRNTSASTFLNNRTYAARKMVAGLGGATPTIAVGDYLLPGTGDDTSGWWKETATAGNAWLRVLEVDNTRAECVCELLV